MLPLAEDRAEEVTMQEIAIEEVAVEEAAVQEIEAEENEAEEIAAGEVAVSSPASAIAVEAVTESATVTATEAVRKAAPAQDVDKSDEDGMASSAERMTILRMIEQGKISAEDGARLLNALGDRNGVQEKARPISFDSARHLQVRVTDLATNRPKVNVNLPVSLVQLAWRWLPASAKMQFEQVEAAISAGSVGRLVEVVDQDSGVRVEITII